MDLGGVRAKLDRLNEQIVSRIKDRSRFPTNDAVYRPAAIPIAGHADLSLMEWSLLGMERYHATLGRYQLPDQLPLRPDTDVASPVTRTFDLPALPAIASPPRDELLRFYVATLPKFCKPGDEPQNYGETAYADADVLVRLNERINLGAFVAQFKLEADPTILRFAASPDDLRESLRDRPREAAVIEKATQAAWRYGVQPDVIADVFRWMIEQTIELEVRFLQAVARAA